MTPEVKERFLCDLAALYLRYGVYITACSCCDSTWLSNWSSTTFRERVAAEIQHLRNQKEESE